MNSKSKRHVCLYLYYKLIILVINESVEDNEIKGQLNSE